MPAAAFDDDVIQIDVDEPAAPAATAPVKDDSFDVDLGLEDSFPPRHRRKTPLLVVLAVLMLASAFAARRCWPDKLEAGRAATAGAQTRKLDVQVEAGPGEIAPNAPTVTPSPGVLGAAAAAAVEPAPVDAARVVKVAPARKLSKKKHH